MSNTVFYYATHGLDAGIYDFMTEQEWNTTPDDQFPANVNWHRVEVANQEDVETYINAQNRYLRAAWTPNQDFDEREENSRIMKEAGQIMSRLDLSKHD